MTRKDYIRGIRSTLKLYFRAKISLEHIVPILLSSKKTLKNVQRLHWEHKELREDVNFINLYNDAVNTYNIAKKQYKYTSMCLKIYKDDIKRFNSKLSKLDDKNGKKLF